MLLGAANGKGMTESYSLASGYAELYERFCNKTFFIANPYWIKSYMENNMKQNHYYFSPDEKILTYEELTASPRVTDYFNLLANDEELAKKSIDFITDKKYVGVPMYNIVDNSILYMDPRLLIRLERTNGMAAGNTIQEALVQGCSELVERLVSESFVFDNDEERIICHALNLDNILNPALKEKIDTIKSYGYDLYIFDLSYNYKLPVLMSLIIDRKSGIIKVNFGSFPIFNIAVERVITELYQGYASLRQKPLTYQLQFPYKAFTNEETLEKYKTGISGRILSANIFDNIQYVNMYNKEVFIDEATSTDELIQYYQKLSQERNIQFYYMDNSLSDQVAAIFILADSNRQFHHTPTHCCDFIKDEITINKCSYLLDILHNFYNALYSHKPVNIDQYIQFLETYACNEAYMKFIHGVLLWNSVFIAERDNGGSFHLLVPLLTITNYAFKEIPPDLLNSELYTSYKKYVQLVQYVYGQVYSQEEILHIFNDIFDCNITSEDIIKCMHPSYLLQKIYIEPFCQYVETDNFKQLIQTFIKGD